jgi:hypothetical protein
MNWTLLGIVLLSAFFVVAAIFVWALIKTAADADRQYEAYLRRNPPDERDPFDRPHGEL